MKNRTRLKVIGVAWSVTVAALMFGYLPLVLTRSEGEYGKVVAVGLSAWIVGLTCWTEWQLRKYARGLVKCDQCLSDLRALPHMETERYSFGICDECKVQYRLEKKT